MQLKILILKKCFFIINFQKNYFSFNKKFQIPVPEHIFYFDKLFPEVSSWFVIQVQSFCQSLYVFYSCFYLVPELKNFGKTSSLHFFEISWSPPTYAFTGHKNWVQTRLCNFPPLNIWYKRTGEIFSESSRKSGFSPSGACTSSFLSRNLPFKW